MSTLDNATSIDRADRSKQTRSFLSYLSPAGLRAALLRGRAATDRLPEWETPTRWIDELGMFIGDDGAWLYHQMPSSAFTSVERLNSFLAHAHARLGDREVHSLSYGWEENAHIPDGLSGPAADFVRGALTMAVPEHLFVFGVKLDADPALVRKETGLLAVFDDLVDRSLAEWVPHFEAWEGDRDNVSGVLSSLGGTPIAGNALALLESWYTLGVSDDVTPDERDDSIFLAGSTIEIAAIRGFVEQATDLNSVAEVVASTPRTGGDGGVSVTSVRGTLSRTTRTVGFTEEPVVAIAGASVLLGRRAFRPSTTLADSLRPMRQVTFKALPLNQVPALDETLPCSTTRVDTSSSRMDAERLAAIGFLEPVPAGDRSGLYVGFVDPDLAYPLYLDLVSGGRGRTLHVGGQTGSGKTYLASHLSRQVAAGHKRVVWVTGDTQPGIASTTLAATPGLLDPLSALPANIAWPIAGRILAQALDATPAEQEDLGRALRQAAAAEVAATGSAVKLIGDPRLMARALRFLSTPAGQLLDGRTKAPTSRATVEVMHLASLLAEVNDPTLRAMYADLASAVAVARAAGGLVVTDSVRAWGHGTFSRQAWEASPSAPALVHTTSRTADLLDADALPGTPQQLLLATPVNDGSPVLSSWGAVNHAELAEWLATAGPSVEDGAVTALAGGWLRGRDGKPHAILVGPAPVTELGDLTAGAAFTYRL